ncbi:hypothetical protein GCM10014715_05100 [Streptomyces spiralis]|uniref:Glyceraldehyde-3-phosphate dehydrogenase n=1 Tax=Streptomyces spiralis TaxID=66376 RepID=A0A918ZIN6_9ACTN|nr:hypothetical protein GCM10014715_05100 [Streptomyces spiralis]
MAAEGSLKGIRACPTPRSSPVTSSADPASCVLDASLTQAHGDMVKVFGWYDNEWGHRNRLLGLTEYVVTRFA